MKDTIYRQEAIDAICTWDKFGVDERNRVVRWHVGLEPYVHLRDVVLSLEHLPSVEPLTDAEQKIFLEALAREEEVCKIVDEVYEDEGYKFKLVHCCREIIRKVKGALWT